jgi:hypothetical protein
MQSYLQILLLKEAKLGILVYKIVVSGGETKMTQGGC